MKFGKVSPDFGDDPFPEAILTKLKEFGNILSDLTRLRLVFASKTRSFSYVSTKSKHGTTTANR